MSEMSRHEQLATPRHGRHVAGLWETPLDTQDVVRAMQVYYDRRAEEYVDWFLRTGLHDDPQTNPAFFRALREIEEMVEEFGQGRVLDIACGIGWWTALLAERAREVIGLDYSPRMLAACRKRLAMRERQAGLVRGSAYALPFADAAFDRCFFGMWLSHVPLEKTSAFFSEVQRITKPGGAVFLVDTTLPGLSDVHAEVQKRRLNDGSEYPTLKVYYGGQGLLRLLEPFAEHVMVRTLEEMFIVARYQTPPQGPA